MTGLNDTCALKARNQGSATAGISDGSFRSKTMEPDLWPLSSAKKYAASGFKSPRIFSIVVPKVPALAAAFPASTGIETLSNIRIPAPPRGKNEPHEYTRRCSSESGISARKSVYWARANTGATWTPCAETRMDKSRRGESIALRRSNYQTYGVAEQWVGDTLFSLDA
jgi:hypothetical protein